MQANYSASAGRGKRRSRSQDVEAQDIVPVVRAPHVPAGKIQGLHSVQLLSDWQQSPGQPQSQVITVVPDIQDPGPVRVEIQVGGFVVGPVPIVEVTSENELLDGA